MLRQWRSLGHQAGYMWNPLPLARMFADDTTLTVSGSGKLIQDIEVAINHDLTNRLSLNLVKTEYLLIGSRYNINN